MGWWCELKCSGKELVCFQSSVSSGLTFIWEGKYCHLVLIFGVLFCFFFTLSYPVLWLIMPGLDLVSLVYLVWVAKNPARSPGFFWWMSWTVKMETQMGPWLESLGSRTIRPGWVWQQCSNYVIMSCHLLDILILPFLHILYSTT